MRASHVPNFIERPSVRARRGTTATSRPDATPRELRHLRGDTRDASDRRLQIDLVKEEHPRAVRWPARRRLSPFRTGEVGDSRRLPRGARPRRFRPVTDPGGSTRVVHRLRALSSRKRAPQRVPRRSRRRPAARLGLSPFPRAPTSLDRLRPEPREGNRTSSAQERLPSMDTLLGSSPVPRLRRRGPAPGASSLGVPLARARLASLPATPAARALSSSDRRALLGGRTVHRLLSTTQPASTPASSRSLVRHRNGGDACLSTRAGRSRPARGAALARRSVPTSRAPCIRGHPGSCVTCRVARRAGSRGRRSRLHRRPAKDADFGETGCLPPPGAPCEPRLRGKPAAGPPPE